MTDAPVLRIEDDHLLRGESTFVANLDLPGVATAHYVTSTVAHANLGAIDTSQAVAAPGVLAVLTATDLVDAGLPDHLPGHNADWPAEMAWQPLARERVRYVGQPVVAIVAETKAQAVDAAELVDIDYDVLPAVIDPRSAADNPTLLFEGTDENVVIRHGADREPIDFSAYEVVIEADFVNNRVHPAPMEGRVGAAEWTDAGQLVFYASCQGVHPVRNAFAQFYGMDNSDVQVITADVGGSFGAKARASSEQILLPHLARVVGRPVRWVPDRPQDMVGLGHSRGQHQHVRLAGSRDGDLQAIFASVIADSGAYPLSQPAQARNTGVMLPGPYDIGEVDWEAVTVATNTTPIAAYRGAGRPESGALLDRAIDMFAAEIDMDPATLRRRNLIPTEAMPFTNPSGLIYDSGDYAEALDLLLEQLDVDAIRSDQATRRAAGETVLPGIGFSVFIDRTAGVRGAEYGSVQLRDDGGLRVLTGSSPYGQGHYTTWAQLVSERTGVAVDDIEVFHGDTFKVPRGGITGGSRSAQKAGSAIAVATEELVIVAKEQAATLLEAAVDDVVLDVTAGAFHVAGAPGAATVGWLAVADQISAEVAAPDIEGHVTDQIVYACESDYENEGPSVPYGAFAAIVEVDTETGEVDLQRMVTVNDVGTVINQPIVDGQIHGAVGQAIGQALWEEFVYDDEGQPLTASLLDYGMPSTMEMPNIETTMACHPSPTNLLGAKGVGEPGCVGGVPAIQNAVVDAVAHLGIRHLDLPVTPQRIWQAIEERTSASE